MQLNEKDCLLTYDPSSAVVAMEGSLRLAGIPEYDPVKDFLQRSAEQAGEKLILDVRGLEFLNSAGITAISLFVIAAKKNGRPRLQFVASKEYAWQGKSLRNFTRLWDQVDLRIE